MFRSQSTTRYVPLTVIADYGAGDLAHAEAALALHRELVQPLLREYEILVLRAPEVNVAPFDTLSAGLEVAELTLASTRADDTSWPIQQIVYVNVAPRSDDDRPREHNVGEKLYCAFVNGTLVVGPAAGHAWSFVKGTTPIYELPFEGAGSQFRSRDYFPQATLDAANRILDGRGLGGLREVSLEDIPDPPELQIGDTAIRARSIGREPELPAGLDLDSVWPIPVTVIADYGRDSDQRAQTEDVLYSELTSLLLDRHSFLPWYTPQIDIDPGGTIESRTIAAGFAAAQVALGTDRKLGKPPRDLLPGDPPRRIVYLDVADKDGRPPTKLFVAHVGHGALVVGPPHGYLWSHFNGHYSIHELPLTELGQGGERRPYARETAEALERLTTGRGLNDLRRVGVEEIERLPERTALYVDKYGNPKLTADCYDASLNPGDVLLATGGNRSRRVIAANGGFHVEKGEIALSRRGSSGWINPDSEVHVPELFARGKSAAIEFRQSGPESRQLEAGDPVAVQRVIFDHGLQAHRALNGASHSVTSGGGPKSVTPHTLA